MISLKGEHINLRALEPEDLNFLYEIENNESFWEISHTTTPFSKFILKNYIENSHLDIYEAKQLRLIIENKKQNQIGTIDLFDFNPLHRRAGLGILIKPEFQNNGHASEALSLLINYSFKKLNLHQIFSNITEDNLKSIALFTKFNFKKIGVKKDWILSEGQYKNEISFQLINE